MLNATEKETAIKDLEVDISKDAEESSDEQQNGATSTKEQPEKREHFKRVLTNYVRPLYLLSFLPFPIFTTGDSDKVMFSVVPVCVFDI